MQLLGAQFRHLDCLDAIYRRDFVGLYLYMGRSVGVSVHPDDWQNCEPRVRHEVEQVLQTYKSQDVHLYVPLGAGGHVDHLLVRRAVELAHESGVIAYCEDFPYADQPDALQSQLQRNGNGATWQAWLRSRPTRLMHASAQWLAMFRKFPACFHLRSNVRKRLCARARRSSVAILMDA